MKESNAGWKEKKVSRYTTRLDKSVGDRTKTVFLKAGVAGQPEATGYGEAEAEYDSYVRLRPFLRMPRVRLLDRGDEGKFLAIQKVNGTPLDELLKQGKLDEMQRALRGFITDLVAMWRDTLQPMDEKQLVLGRNVRLIYLDRIATLRNHDAIHKIIDKRVIINGKEYSSLAQRLGSSEKLLANTKEPVMSYAHGDEMLQNVISTPGEPSEYMAIDPRSAGAGYYTPAQSANYLIGLTFLYNYDWNSQTMRTYNDRIEIDYSISDSFKEKDKVLRQLFVELVENLETLGPAEKEMLQEYLFSNLIRTYIGQALPGNLAKLEPNKIAHLALALELGTDLVGVLRKPSYISESNSSQ